MKAVLLNPSMEEHPLSRDMAGGLGFDAADSMLLPPIDLATLAARLLAVGWEVQLLDAQAERLGHPQTLELLRGARPDVLLGLVSLPTLVNDCRILRKAREVGVARVFARTGINHPPILHEMLAKSEAEAAIFGEPDLCLERVFLGEERRGTAWLEDGTLRVAPPLMVDEPDAIPLPARGLLDNQRYFYPLLDGPATTVQTTRGCPYSCGYFCPYPAVQGTRWRSRSPAHVLAEIADCVENHGLRNILFRDATFTLNRKRTQQICEALHERGYPLRWWCETRVDCLDRATLEAMKRAGCRGINVGVETGNEEIMQTQAKVGLTLPKLKQLRAMASDLDLRLHFLLIVGLPKETRRSIHDTYRLIRELDPETIGVTAITPYPGTPLYGEAKSKGWIETEDWSKYDGHVPTMHTDDLRSEEIAAARKWMHRGFSLAKRRDPWSRLKSRRHDAAFRKWSLAP